MNDENRSKSEKEGRFSLDFNQNSEFLRQIPKNKSKITPKPEKFTGFNRKKDQKPGFRVDISCPVCKTNDFGVILRQEKSLFWCRECYCFWSLQRNIETIIDKEGRI